MGITMASSKNTSFSLYIVLSLGLFAAFLVTFVIYVMSEKKIDSAHELRYQSVLLANELRQTSYDLTKMTRNYVLTGDVIYKHYYQDILDIRDGKTPRPPGYQANYWDFVLANKQISTTAHESPITLMELMRLAEFSEQELRTLLAVKTNSEALTAIELTAMKMLETATSEAEIISKRETAVALLLSDAYNQAKASTIEPINRFYDLMSKRTQTAVEHAEYNALLVRLVLIGFGVSLVLMLWRITQVLHTTLGGSVDDIYAQIIRIGSGDFSSVITVGNAQNNSVMGWLAETQRNLNKLRQERVQAEGAKRESDARYNILSELSTAGIWQIDTHGYTLYINHSMCTMLEVEHAAQLTTQTFHAFFTEASLERMRIEHDKRATGTASSYEVELIGLRGKRLDVLVSGAPLMDEGGKLCGLLGTFQNITERKNAEEQLRRSEENLAITLQSIGDAVIATDPAGKITRMNSTAEYLTGWPLDEAAGRMLGDVFNIINADTRLPSLNPVELVMEHGEVVGLANHTTLIARDGSEYQISDSAAPIRDSSGQIVGVVLVFSNVTEKYRAEEALRRADERFRSTFKLIPNPLTLQTKEGVLLDCSDAFCESTGFTRDEILGRNTEDLGLWVNPEQRAGMRELIQRDGKVDNFEFQLRRRNGEIRIMQISARFLSNEPEPILLAVAHDITERRQAEEALRLSELRLRTIIDNEPECVKIVDAKGVLLEMNTAGLAMLEASSVEEIKKHSLIQFVLPDYRAAFIAMHQHVMAGKNTILAFEIVGLRGTRRWLETHAAPMRDPLSGEVIKLLGVTRDVTLQKQAELALRESVLHTQAILNNMLDGVITINTQGLIESFNKAASTIFGYNPDEVIGRNISMLMPEKIKALHDGYLSHHVDTGHAKTLGTQLEVEGKRKDGNLFPMSLSVSKILREGKLTFIGLIRDITQQRRDEEKINRLAFYDPLTNLPNRRLLFDRLSQAIITSSRTDQHGALMFLDLDYFKQLNDTLGHDLGDELLKQVALGLQTCIREGDTVARMGGDEFVLLIEALSLYPNEAASQAEMIANKVLMALGEPYILGDHTYTITPSIGIVVFLNQTETMEELLKKADVAMYQAKAAGRNNARFFDPTMQAAVSVRVELEKSMRQALEAKEFILHYQIQVDGKGKPTGVEALLRWNHSKHGMISPAVFIPLAEETGMILTLGQWVLEAACAQLVEWTKTTERSQWTMAVNVSVFQFSQANFIENIQLALQKTGANPHQLKLELTESMLVKDVDDVIIKMTAIKALGVTFSLDDFGTGYSSLSYLKRLPLDQLKIDQSFVRDLLTDPNDAVIARAIVALGHSLGIKVIAEGVETGEQHKALESMGCDAFQGYYFARPVAAQDLAVTIDKIPT